MKERKKENGRDIMSSFSGSKHIVKYVPPYIIYFLKIPIQSFNGCDREVGKFVIPGRLGWSLF